MSEIIPETESILSAALSFDAPWVPGGVMPIEPKALSRTIYKLSSAASIFFRFLLALFRSAATAATAFLILAIVALSIDSALRSPTASM